MSKKTTGLMLFALLWSGCDGCGDEKRTPKDDVDASDPTAEVTLTVLHEDARSCEVMLAEQAWEVSNVHYQPEVTGEWERWPPRVALAFTHGKDEPLGQVLTLDLRRKADGEPGEFESVAATCYDRLGKAIEGAEVRVD